MADAFYDIIANINTEMKLLETLYADMWFEQMGTELAHYVKNNGIDPETVNEKFVDEKIESVEVFFINTFRYAADVVQANQSTWSGGNSVTNMVEQMKRKIAGQFLHRRHYPLDTAKKVVPHFKKQYEKIKGK